MPAHAHHQPRSAVTEPSSEPDAPLAQPTPPAQPAPPALPAAELQAVLDRVADGIARPSAEAETAAREQVGSGTPDASRLGRLAEWVIWLSGVQDSYPPRPLDRVHVLVAGLSPSTRDTVRHLADLPGVTMKDVVLQGDSTMEAAAEAGSSAVDAAVDAGCDLLICSAAVPAALTTTLVAVLLRLSAVEVVADSDHLDDAAWAELVADIRDRSRAVRGLEDDPIAVLHALDSPELAALVAMLLRAAARRTPVLLDGPPDSAAALCATRHSILGSWWRLAAATSSDPATARAIDALGLEPVTALECRLGGGAAGLTALPLLRAAQAFVAPD
jgi:NaMN:DMB phosphoribosyltransferase